MATRPREDNRPTTPKHRYRVQNWAEYDRAQVNRGHLTIWFDEESIDS